MSRDLGRDVPHLEKLHARKLWAAFSYPTKGTNRANEVLFGAISAVSPPAAVRCGSLGPDQR